MLSAHCEQGPREALRAELPSNVAPVTPLGSVLAWLSVQGRCRHSIRCRGSVPQAVAETEVVLSVNAHVEDPPTVAAGDDDDQISTEKRPHAWTMKS